MSSTIKTVWNGRHIRLKDIFIKILPTSLKSQVYDQYVLPVVTYGAKIFELTKNTLEATKTLDWQHKSGFWALDQGFPTSTRM